MVELRNLEFVLGGCNIEGEEDSWDFGTGAGFYVDATEEKWQINYRMYTYITEEVNQSVKVKEKIEYLRVIPMTRQSDLISSFLINPEALGAWRVSYDYT